MEELNNLTFVKDNAQKLMERKVSFERQRDKRIAVRKWENKTIHMHRKKNANYSLRCVLLGFLTTVP